MRIPDAMATPARASGPCCAGERLPMNAVSTKFMNGSDGDDDCDDDCCIVMMMMMMMVV